MSIMAKKTYKISEIKLSYSQKEKVFNGLFSVFGIKSYFVVAEINDTNYKYWMYTEKKINKVMLNNMEQFIKGVCYAVV